MDQRRDGRESLWENDWVKDQIVPQYEIYAFLTSPCLKSCMWHPLNPAYVLSYWQFLASWFESLLICHIQNYLKLSLKADPFLVFVFSKWVHRWHPHNCPINHVSFACSVFRLKVYHTWSFPISDITDCRTLISYCWPWSSCRCLKLQCDAFLRNKTHILCLTSIPNPHQGKEGKRRNTQSHMHMHAHTYLQAGFSIKKKT